MAKKIVDFYKWCDSCINKNKEEWEEPCNECLANTVNEDSDRPVFHKQDPNKKDIRG